MAVPVEVRASSRVPVTRAGQFHHRFLNFNQYAF
jgi:hypothetical protein